MPVDLSVFDKIKTKADYDQLNAEFQLKKQLAAETLMKAQQGAQLPAAIQIANEYGKARATGDTQRMNDLLVAAKSLDKGLIQNPDGSVTSMTGYAPAAAGIQGAIAGSKEQAQKGVDLVMDPQIKTGVQNAANASDLQYALPTRQAGKQGELNAVQQGDMNKKAVSATNNISIIDQILTPDETGKTVLDRATGSGIGAMVAGGEKFFGKSTPATQANAQLNVLGGQLLNNVPRMEGPQSDRDVESYREQAGKIADPSIPAKDKYSALEIIRAIGQKYEGLNTSGVQGLPDSALPVVDGTSPGMSLPVNSTSLIAGAKKAPDGKYYVPDPNRPGKYLMVQ